MTLAGEKSVSRERRAGLLIVVPAAVAGIVWTTPPGPAGSIHGCGYSSHTFGGHERVEVYAGHPFLFQLLSLGGAPLYAHLPGGVVVAAGSQCAGQWLGQVDVEYLGQHRQLVGRGNGFQSRYDGYGDAFGPAALDKVEVLLVVEEHLGYHIRGAGIDFGFEVSQVGLGVGCLVVFLGVAGHTVGEGRGEGHVRPVEKVSLVEAVDLLLQVDGVGVSLGRGGEAGLVFGLVAPQNEQVGNAQEVEVDKGIFGLTSGKTAAYQVRNGGYMILVLYGGSYGYGAGAALFRYPLVEAVVGSLVDKLTPVRGDVDVFGIELAQRVDGVENFAYAVPFQRWEYFKGEGRLTAVFDYFGNIHCIIFYGKNTFFIGWKRLFEREFRLKLFYHLFPMLLADGLLSPFLNNNRVNMYDNKIKTKKCKSIDL